MTNKYSVEAPPISGHKDVGSLIRTYGLANVGSKKKQTSEDEEIEPPLEADPLIDAVLEGSWPAIAQQDLTTVELSNLAHRVKSLKIPPVGPRLGVLRVDGKPYSQHSGSVNFGGARGAEWKPKVDCLLASSSNITEHTSPVPRLSVAPDQSFFVSASHDGTSKVWEMRNLEAAVDLKSVVTYHGQNGGRVNDVTLLENSHSVATAGSDGSVHVWRIDMVGSYANTSQNQDDGTTQSQRMYYETGRVQVRRCKESLRRAEKAFVLDVERAADNLLPTLSNAMDAPARRRVRASSRSTTPARARPSRSPTSTRTAPAFC